jgi:mono/diheme cytochrome c family protein/heme/copper-type cytochrome/quinol oxidase subunit 3
MNGVEANSLPPLTREPAMVSTALPAPSSTMEQASGAADRLVWRPVALYLLLCAELAAVVAAVAVYIVIRQAYPETLSQRLGHTGWGAGQLLLAVLAGLSAGGAIWSIRNRWSGPAMLLLAASIMYGILLLGAVAMERLHVRQSDAHIVIPHQQIPQYESMDPDRRAASPVPAEQPMIPHRIGDIIAGRTAYISSCLGCHGPEGAGMAGVSPAMRGTPFMSQISDEALWQVIVDGRAADDPSNTTSRVMPPRGGNPFLSDDSVRDIIAYLRALNDDGADAAAVPGDEDASGAGAVHPDPALLVPRWVVPPASHGPAGLALDVINRPRGDEMETKKSAIAAGVYGVFAGLLALHVMLAMAIGGWLMVRAWDGRLGPRSQLVASAHGVYWLAAAAAWLLLFPLLFL